MMRKVVNFTACGALKVGLLGGVQKPTAGFKIFMAVSNMSTAPTKKREPLSERVLKIDTTLTSEQQEYVDSLKKKLKGGPLSKKSIYREVPTIDELQAMGNFMPRLAENAEQLIDFALSHIPKATGPRRSRYKKRLERKAETAYHAKKKVEKAAAYQRKLLKIKKVRKEVKDMWALVNSEREKKAAIAEFKAKNKSV